MMVPGNQSGENLVNALFKPRLVKEEEIKVKTKALEVIDFLNLKHLYRITSLIKKLVLLLKKKLHPLLLVK